MKPIVYEIKRTLTSKFVIIMIIAIVGLSSLLAYGAASTYSPSPVPSTPQVSYGYFANGTNLTMVGYAHNAYGQPVSKITAYYEYNGTYYSAKSGPSGFANATIPIGGTQPIFVYANYSYVIFRVPLSTHQIPIEISKITIPSGLEIIPGIVNPTNTTEFGYELMYVGSNGAKSPSINFYIGKSNLTSSEIVKSPSFSYTDISGFNIKNIYPPVTYADHNTTYRAVATNSSGVVIGKTSRGIPLTYYTPMTQSSLQSLVFEGTTEILGFLIPILAVFAAYLTYGKDRTSGVLESVLKRPVTRGSLITSRFTSNAISIFIAVGLSMIFSDLILHHYFGMYLSTKFSLYFVWTYLVEGVAFLAIVYMFSHIAKSQGAVLGAAIALFVVMDLFWSIIPIAVLSALKVSSSSTAYVYGTIAFNYASPAGYSSLVQTMFTHKIGLISSQTIVPSDFGISGLTLIIAGILWMIIPFAIAFLLSKNRD
ncbi:ABC transporter permease subunit [Oxyplasma meridianum]|uniref:ABC transporter permease subunit n=1 Tax=Oxyplasma meridianum TaxID=3073602 RepID=A0AAX4NGB9_9ARCH